MSQNVTNVIVPAVCTRGIILFPGQDVMIEVGRSKSTRAVNEASASYDSMVWLVCQNDIMVDNPRESDLYRVGTLSKIKVIRKKDGFMHQQAEDVPFTSFIQSHIAFIKKVSVDAALAFFIA